MVSETAKLTRLGGEVPTKRELTHYELLTKHPESLKTYGDIYELWHGYIVSENGDTNTLKHVLYQWNTKNHSEQVMTPEIYKGLIEELQKQKSDILGSKDPNESESDYQAGVVARHEKAFEHFKSYSQQGTKEWLVSNWVANNFASVAEKTANESAVNKEVAVPYTQIEKKEMPSIHKISQNTITTIDRQLGVQHDGVSLSTDLADLGKALKALKDLGVEFKGDLVGNIESSSRSSYGLRGEEAKQLHHAVNAAIKDGVLLDADKASIAIVVNNLTEKYIGK